MFMFICWLSKKKSHKEFEFTKLEFHITKNSSLVSSSTFEKQYQAFYLQRTRAWYARVLCCMELEFTKLEYHIIFF